MLNHRLYRTVAIAFLLAGSAIGPTGAGINEWTTQGPYGGDVTALAVDPDAPTTLYAGTRDAGIFKSTDDAATWAPANVGLPDGFRVSSLVLDPQQPATLYAAAPNNLFYKSTDGGDRWISLEVGPPLVFPQPVSSSLSTLAINPVTPTNVYAGRSREGVFRSLDAGASWQEANSGLTAIDVRSVAVDPQVPSTLYAGTSAGVFKSTDSGDTWAATGAGVPGRPVQILVHPADSAIVYAVAAADFTSSGIHRSTDAGASWTRLSFSANRFTRSMLIDPTDPSTLYAATSSDSDVFKSTDGGDTWSSGSEGITSVVVLSLAIDPQNPTRLYAGTDFDHGVFRSTDSGVNWTASNHGLAATSVLDMEVDPVTPSTLYATSNRGVFKSLDAGQSWTIRDNGLFHVSLESLAIDPRDPSTLYAGSDLQNFGDGVYRTTDGADSWQRVPGPFFFNGSIEDLEVDPVTSGVWAGTAAGLFESSDGGMTWLERTSGLPSSIIVDLAIDPTNPSTLYAATIDFGATGRVSKSTDGGASWSAAGSGLPGTILFSLAIDPVDPATVYAAGLGGVFKTVDGGATWVDTGGPTDGFAFAVAIDPRTPTTLVASTESGVFSSGDGGATWSPLNEGLSQLVGDLEFDPQRSNVLYAATADGGVFDLELLCVPGPETLCIDGQPGDQRFEVTLAYETEIGAGSAGDARAIPLAPLGITRGGILWFFDPTNPEVLVKVLDGCGINQRYWVFAAAATDVGFELKVTDRFTGLEKVYVNPDQTPAATVTDTDAFAVCPAVAPAATDVAIIAPKITVPAKGTGACANDDTTLCIDDQAGDGRFRVRVSYASELGGGIAGDARAVPLEPLAIDRGGVLWFFDPTNPEILIKVLDGCGINDRFWVFYAATTDVGFEVTVEDTVAGVEKTYSNPDLTAAAPITDTNAFATCEF